METPTLGHPLPQVHFDMYDALVPSGAEMTSDDLSANLIDST